MYSSVAKGGGRGSAAGLWLEAGLCRGVPGRAVGEVEHHWGCGLSFDEMHCWQCWGGVMRMLRVLNVRVRVRVRVRTIL